MKSLIKMTFLLGMLLVGISNAGVINTSENNNEISPYNTTDVFDATYERPLNLQNNSTDIISLEKLRNNTNADYNNIILSRDSLNKMGMTMGQFLLKNPGKAVHINGYIDKATINKLTEEKELYRERHLPEIDAIADKWMKLKTQDKTSANSKRIILSDTREQIAINKLLAGGSGSLDRQIIFSFVFIEGNGPAKYDWTDERLEYSIIQAEIFLDNIIDEAYRHGIKLKLYQSYSIIPINYEPIYETSGTEFAPYVTIDGLDPWRSAAIGDMGYDPNLEGLYDFNIKQCGSKGAAEGAICFMVNFDTSMTHTNGEYADWASGWIPDYLVTNHTAP